jgi:hypothetical protein
MAVAGLNTTLTDQGPPSSAGDYRPVRSRAVAWSVVGIVFVECLYALWTASRGYFFQDDFIDLQALRQLGLDGRLFEQPVFGHFIPGFNFVDYLISLIVPYPWWLIVLFEVLLFGLSLFLLDHLLTILFGRTWLGVALVAIAGASFSLVPSLVWWATALEYLVAIPATLLACILHVRYLRTGRVRYAAFGGGALAVGLVFYDGLFVSVFFIVLMTVLIWPVGPGLEGVSRTLVVHWRAWVCYGIPIALELGWRFTHPGRYITGGSASIAQILGFIGLAWTQTFIPLTFGVDAWVLPAHAERIVAGLLGQVILVVFVVGTLLRRRSAWRAWVLIGATFLLGAAIVGATRAGTYGPGDASDVKYFALDAFFLAIAVGFALLPVRLSTTCPPTTALAESAGSRGRSNLRTARPAWFRALVVVTALAVVVVYGAALIFDQNRDSESTASHAAHRYFANFSTSWAARTTSAIHPFLWDTEINPSVVTRAFFPYDTASVTVGRLHPDTRFDEWGGTGFLLRSDGSVERATAVTQARGLITGRSACAHPPHGPGRIVVTLDHRLNGARRWFGLVSYQSAAGAKATQLDGTTVVFPKGTGTLITTFPAAPLGSVVWNVQPRTSVCITGLTVVLPEPARTYVRAASRS